MLRVSDRKFVVTWAKYRAIEFIGGFVVFLVSIPIFLPDSNFIETVAGKFFSIIITSLSLLVFYYAFLLGLFVSIVFCYTFFRIYNGYSFRADSAVNILACTAICVFATDMSIFDYIFKFEQPNTWGKSVMFSLAVFIFYHIVANLVNYTIQTRSRSH